MKPQYQKSEGTLIKATQPFERINIDFKGPLPTVTNNQYMLTIVDEYSRFPFAFPCANMSTPTVIKCMVMLFSFFGMPGYVHSDRGPSLISEELKTFLNERGVATSRTSAYNPQGNGQVERYNGVIWKAVSLALESRGLPPSNWEQVLPDALHSIRSLLCTATNSTPHDRMFNFQRRSSSGHSVPSWLTSADKAYLRKRVRQSKYDPLVEEVEVLHANPQYAHVLLPSGIESTVSIRDLAPCGSSLDSRVESLPPPQYASTAAPPATSAPTTSASSPLAEEIAIVQDEPVIFLNPLPEATSAVDVPTKEVRVRKPRKRWLEEC